MKEKELVKKDIAQKVIRIAMLMVMDVIIINLATFLTLYARFDFNLSSMLNEGFADVLPSYALITTVVSIAIFIPAKLYNSLWEFAGVDELLHIGIAGVILTVFRVALNFLSFSPYQVLPRSFPFISGMLLICFIGASRMLYRSTRNLLHRSKANARARTLLIGAGSAGAMALREFQNSNHSENEVVCIVDDDFVKRGGYLRNVKIVGNRHDIPAVVEKYRIDQIVMAIPGASAEEKRDILHICQQTKCKLKTLPGIFQLANGEVTLEKIRNVDVLDLLGRDSVKVDLTEIAAYIQGKTVLVTGGGGSIGSELCRQIAKNQPQLLILLDIYENNAYDIQQELRRDNPGLKLEVRIGSVRDAERVNMLFEEFHPQIVFHAAAHKHVPLMEDSPNEAIKNNVFGTLHVAQAADRYHAEKFVMISTDKAVNPTNIMGASKRICEMIVQLMSTHSATKFVAVRFGNVLGSNGSVIPLFRKQIEAGGPVTVTHKDIIRYFMTIPEAVSLVLQAGAFADQGEIFVLDMGDPVRIDDLARNMIRLSGFEPEVDIKIEYTGLRPGEKLYEEMLMQEEGLRTTANEMIHIGKPLDMDEDIFKKQLLELQQACADNSPHIREQVAQIVPTYHIPTTVR